jgi:signal transducing adaptor molecule
MSILSLVDEITSPNLQDDDYGLLLDLVELVNRNPSSNVIESLRFLKVKLQSSNANTLLRSITMLDFLAENCGAMMKAQIATASFVNENLLPILEDNIIHISVKAALVKEIYKLSESFANDDSLSIMKSTFASLKNKFPDLCNDAVSEVDGKPKVARNYNAGPSSQIQDEDLELRKAIEMSLKESNTSSTVQIQTPAYPPAQAQSQVQSQAQSQAPTQFQQSPMQAPPPQIITQQELEPLLEEDPSKPDKVVALYDLSADDEDTLSFKKDDIITIVEEINEDWLRGCLNGRAGIVPMNYVKRIPKTTNKDLNNLIMCLNDSFDIETALSQLMDLNKKVKSTEMTSQQFESILLSNSFPNKIQKIEEMKETLKQILELHKLKHLELQSLQSNINGSLELYQKMISHAAPTPQDPTISQFIQQYPDISTLSISPNPQSPHLSQPQVRPTATGSANQYIQQQQQQQQQQQPYPPNLYN